MKLRRSPNFCAVLGRDLVPRRLPSQRKGFTLVELLIVIVIIGILVGLLLPAVQVARESARMATCANKLNQLSKACLNYESGSRVYPPAFTDVSFVKPADAYLGNSGTIGTGTSMLTAPWTVRILPFIDDVARYNKFTLKEGSFDGCYSSYPAVNIAQAYTPNPAYWCPSHLRSTGTTPNTDYFGVSGGGQAAAPPTGKKPSDGYQWCTGVYGNQNFFSNGVIVANGSFSAKDIPDGTSKQLMLAESRYQFTLETEQAWAALDPTNAWVGRVSRPSWAGASRGGTFVGPHSTTAAVVNGINSSPLVDVSTVPPSACGGSTSCAGEMTKTFGSYHPGGCNMAFADGSVQFLAQTIDITLYRRLGSRADGNTGNFTP